MSKILCALLGLMCPHTVVFTTTALCASSLHEEKPCIASCLILDVETGKSLATWPARDDGNCYSEDQRR